ncbi:helix-turn-helix domain-containing protein [Aquisalimonas sp.]|uniref:helix-turn-helix domain-containing protein n=1 Tax=Aquisalimonas sp. TaxID=1872621 RepID=UPI0025BB1806|nr:helix-turn-helix domain-containing protein [Aquisalimonas sp.]
MNVAQANRAKLRSTKVDHPGLAFNLHETAIALRMSVPTVRGLIKDKKLRAKREGRRWIVSRQAIEEYLAS